MGSLRDCMVVKNFLNTKDIKPNNLLLDRYGHLRLSDFDMCKPLDFGTPEEKDFTTLDNVSNSTGDGNIRDFVSYPSVFC
ncbi:hypothetical protein L1987_43018 [Smallanthus sonchifolius]|uniref:Uncharacterized protein n=1 Tax=Smallanthus sonchifolius TaxID=185202 RepID=A0ACB9GMG9_9ASTR|nr:hypothetical protein L1987_43018 [Smallanthus sonchifolius]